jgi:hypothetical protein
MRVSHKLMVALLLMLLAPSMGGADDRDEANSREKALEQRQDQADRDWKNYSWLRESDKFAAIAYSTTTGKYGFSFDFSNLSDARKRAVQQCKAKDARVVVWASNGYCALATGKDRKYGWGFGDTAAQAEAHALAECKKRTTECKILQTVYSGR